MITQNLNLSTGRSTAEAKDSKTVVAEKLALNLMGYKPFTAAEMWNIQRRRRSFTQRRFNA